MLKTLVVALLVLLSSSAFAEGVTGIELGSGTPAATECDVCTIQLYQALNVGIEARPNLEIDWNIPTDEYKDALVVFPDVDRIVFATMRCFHDGRPMERVN